MLAMLTCPEDVSARPRHTNSYTKTFKNMIYTFFISYCVYFYGNSIGVHLL